MIVRDLIAALDKLPQDADVAVLDTEGDWADCETVEYSKEENTVELTA